MKSIVTLLGLLCMCRALFSALAVYDDTLYLCNATHVVRQRAADRAVVGDAEALAASACAFLFAVDDRLLVVGHSETSVALLVNGTSLALSGRELPPLRDIVDAQRASESILRLRVLLAASPTIRRIDVNVTSGTAVLVDDAAPADELPTATISAVRGVGTSLLVLSAQGNVSVYAPETQTATVLATAPGALRWADVALWRCSPLVLDGAGAVVELNVSLCSTSTALPTTTLRMTFETARVTTNDFVDEDGTGVQNGFVPGFEGTVDARGAAKSRPPSLGLGIDPSKRTDNFGPFAISAVVVAVVAFIGLSALIARATSNYLRLGRVAPNRRETWKTGD